MAISPVPHIYKLYGQTLRLEHKKTLNVIKSAFQSLGSMNQIKREKKATTEKHTDNIKNRRLGAQTR